MTQRRWFCDACTREWLPNTSAAGADPWTPLKGCPSCQSAEIHETEYRAEFPGGDIPRTPLVPYWKDIGNAPSGERHQSLALVMKRPEEDELAAQWEALGR